MSNPSFNLGTSAPLNLRHTAAPVVQGQAKSQANSTVRNDNGSGAAAGGIDGIRKRDARYVQNGTCDVNVRSKVELHTGLTESFSDAGGVRGYGGPVIGYVDDLVPAPLGGGAGAIHDTSNANSDDQSGNDGDGEDEDDNIADSSIQARLEFAASYPFEADIRLRIRDRTGVVYNYDVQKRLMKNASQVWREIFAAQQKVPVKAKTRKEVEDLPVLDLTQERQRYDVAGLEVVLWLIHERFSKVERAPAMKLLYNVAQVVETYQCWEVLASHMKDWLVHIDRYICEHHDKVDDEKLLFINWVFGDAHLFPKLLLRVTHKATLDKNGDLRDSRGRLWSLNPDLPRAIIDFIAQIRLKSITGIHNSIWQVGWCDGFRHVGDNEGNNFTPEDFKLRFTDMCIQLQLDSFLFGLIKAGLSHFTTETGRSEFRESVNLLANKILDIKIARLHIPDGPDFLGWHVGCGTDVRALIVKILKGHYAVLPQEMEEKMKERQLRSEACPGMSDVVRGCRCAFGHGF